MSKSVESSSRLVSQDERYEDIPVLSINLADCLNVILQRVASASVTVDKQLISSIGRGILVFAAVAPKDTQQEVDKMVSKILRMKLWPDENGVNVCLILRKMYPPLILSYNDCV